MFAKPVASKKKLETYSMWLSKNDLMVLALFFGILFWPPW